MININKRYRTRDGREVRIYAVDGGGKMPVHGAVLERGEWLPELWSASGDWAPQDCAASPYDLIEVHPRIQREVWVNVYPDKNGDYSQLKSLANAMASKDRIACIKVDLDFQEGEGL